MANQGIHVAVAGAGIVGLSCALCLQQRGYAVTLIDGNTPGSITSSGNACTIADYGCIPINSPSLPGRLPKLLWDSDSPVSVDLGYALAHLPWMLKFLRFCKPQSVNWIIQSLGSILRHADAGINPLLKLTGAENLLVQNGIIYVYETEPEFQADWSNHAIRIEQGSTIEKIGRGELQDLEPNLSSIFQYGALFPTVRHILNPQKLTTRYFDHFVKNGGNYVNSHAEGILHNPTGMKIFLENKQFLRANKLVVSAGAFSRKIEGCDAEKLPLDTERGYNIQYPGLQHLISRPIAWASGGFYAVPTDEALRFSGTVEIAGLNKPKGTRHVEYLTRRSKQMFKLDSEPASDWMGYRPTLPDSLPVIGPSLRSPNTFYAFGHQHLGMTLAGITGKLVGELVSGETPSIDLDPFNPNRFKRHAPGPIEVKPAATA